MRYLNKKFFYISFALISAVFVPLIAYAKSFGLINPLGETDTVGELLHVLTLALLQIAVPIAIIFIILAGIMFLTSQGVPEKVSKAKKMLIYTLVGFSIILIGEGFVSLISSILEMRK